MDSKDGGWLVFQRRQDGSVDFQRNWQNYTDGFGNLLGKVWLGLEKLHLLTSQRRYVLLVNLATYDNGTKYAHYDRFYISDESQKFQLLLGGHSGTTVNSMEVHNGWKFSTFDNDNDMANSNCAKHHKGGWWYYNRCHRANLNGLYFTWPRRTIMILHPPPGMIRQIHTRRCNSSK